LLHCARFKAWRLKLVALAVSSGLGFGTGFATAADITF